MGEEVARTGGLPADIAVETAGTSLSPLGYELLEEIGHGGMGVVYRARDVALDRDVAVKLLSERCPADSPAAQRFLSEARITGQLQHPGIPAVHQVGTLADGRPFLAMKLIKGSTLEAILKQRVDPSAERGRLLAIFEAVCQAVGYAHAHRVIHRDLKPANVMVGASARSRSWTGDWPKCSARRRRPLGMHWRQRRRKRGRGSVPHRRAVRTPRPAASLARRPSSRRSRRAGRSSGSTSAPMCSAWAHC